MALQFRGREIEPVGRDLLTDHSILLPLRLPNPKVNGGPPHQATVGEDDSHAIGLFNSKRCHLTVHEQIDSPVIGLQMPWPRPGDTGYVLREHPPLPGIEAARSHA